MKSQKTVEKFFAPAPAKTPSLSAQQKRDEAEAASDPSAKKRGRKTAAVAGAVVQEEMHQETAAQVAAAAASVPRKAKETQRTLTESRNSLSPTHLEQTTVVRMFIRNFRVVTARSSCVAGESARGIWQNAE